MAVARGHVSRLPRSLRSRVACALRRWVDGARAGRLGAFGRTEPVRFSADAWKAWDERVTEGF